MGDLISSQIASQARTAGPISAIGSTAVLLLLIGFVALATIIGTAFWLGIRTQDSFEAVIAARNVRAAAIDLRSALQDAETSQRGYLLTDREAYLQPYQTAVAGIPQQIAHLGTLLGTDPALARPWQDAKTAIAGKLDELAQTIALKQADRDADALAIVSTDRGKVLMDQARGDFDTIVNATEARITEAVGAQRGSTAALSWVSLIGALIILLVVGGAALTVWRYTRQLRQAGDDIAALNSGLEQRVRERTSELAQANVEIQRFAYIVTHDLRAPLVNIMGFTAELETGIGDVRSYLGKVGAPGDDAIAAAAHKAVDADLPEAIGFIRSSTRKMDGLISIILKLAREGGRPLRPETIDLHDLLEASVAAVQHQITAAQGEVKIDVAVPKIVADKLSLEQVFGNLIDNAIKYRSPQRPLRISMQARPARHGKVEVQIADNGRGIAPSDHQRVFELFRRAGTQDQPGEGIGLAYVRTLIRNLGGDVRMTSALDQGTTFVVSLPQTFQPIRESKPE